MNSDTEIVQETVEFTNEKKESEKMVFRCGICGEEIGENIKHMVEDIPVCEECFARTHTPIRRMARRIGRNELCPCQSGRKYKKCCIAKINEET